MDKGEEKARGKAVIDTWRGEATSRRLIFRGGKTEGRKWTSGHAEGENLRGGYCEEGLTVKMGR